MPFYTLYTFIILSITIVLTGCSSPRALYTYKGTPCEKNVFTTTTETISLQYEPSYSYQAQFGVSDYYLEEYQKYRDERRITSLGSINKIRDTYSKEIKLYPVGSPFIILKLYSYFSSSFSGGSFWSHYYLIRSLEDNQTMWFNLENINLEKCSMNTNVQKYHYSENHNQADYLRKTYEYTSLDANWFTADDFAKDEDLFAISRQYQKKHWSTLQQKFQEKNKNELYRRIKNNSLDYYYYQWLEKNHVNINVRYQNNETPLIMAAKQHNTRTVEYLLKLGADTLLKDNNSKIAIDYLSREDNFHAYAAIKIHEAKQNASKNKGKAAITITKMNKSSDKVTVQQIYVDKTTWSPLILAIQKHENTKALQMIRNKQYLLDKTNNGSTPIFAAVIYKNNLILNTLLEIGADVNMSNNYGLTPLYAAVIKTNPYAVKQLLNYDANMYYIVDGDDITVFIRSITDNKEEIVKLFLKNHIDVNRVSKTGISPLNYVAHDCSNPEMFTLILEYGATPSTVDIHGNTTFSILKKYCKDKTQLAIFTDLLKNYP